MNHQDTKTLRPILNREFEHPTDGWYHIEAKGNHTNAEAKVVQVIDDAAVGEIVNRFNAQAAEANFPGMLIDHEHFRHDADKESVAYGWLMKLQNRDDGIYGQVRWTGTGKRAVDEGDYRFFSTEYDPGKCTVLNRGNKIPKLRPLQLAGLTLTNANNNKGQKPITNRNFRQDSTEDVETPADKQTKGTMKSVNILVGLSAEASEEALHAEVTKILNRAATAEAALTPITNRATTAEAKIKDLEAVQIETDLEVYKNRFKPAAREGWKKALLTNRADTIELLKGMDVLKEGLAPNRITNRETQKQPGTATGATSAASDAEKVQEITELVGDYCIKNRCSHEVGWNAIRRQKPELFASATE